MTATAEGDPRRGERLTSEEALAGTEMLVVLGGPGAGKSWLARRYARQAAERALAALKGGAALEEVELPLLTTWDRWAKTDAEGGLRAGLVQASFVTGVSDLGAEMLTARLRRSLTRSDSRVLVIVDSLDEAANALDRAAATEAVGRYGPDVDAALAGTYPGLLTAATDARTTEEWGEGGALSQQQRETAEALTAESTARTLRGDDDVAWGQEGERDLDREEAAITQDGEAAEHRGRQSDASSDVERARDEKVTAQFTPARTTANMTTPRRTTSRISPAAPTQARTRVRGR